MRRQAQDSVLEASTIPVAQDMERIQVTTDMTDKIGQRRTERSIKMTTENTLFEIKQTLNWRKLAIDMMNHNTSKVLVRSLENEKLDNSESRSIISTRPDGKFDSDLHL